MQKKDTIIVYKSYLQTLELTINNLENIGFDMSKYRMIKNEITQEEYQNRIGNQSKKLLIDYNNSTKKIKVLLEDIKKYDVYYRVNYSCDWINTKLKKDNISEYELDSIIKELKMNIVSIINSNTINYKVEKDIIDKLYRTTFRVMEIEILLNGNSSLYDFVKKESINNSYLNKIIVEKINVIKKDDIDLKEKVYEIQKEGINSSFLNIELIEKLIQYDEILNKNNFIINRLNEYKTRINDNNIKIKSLINDGLKEDTRITTNKWELKDTRKYIKKRVISLLLSISLLSGASVFLSKLEKKVQTKQSYIESTSVYSTINDDTKYSESISFEINPSKKVTIKEYDEFTSNSSRKYTLYDVSEYDLETAKDYYEYGIENFNVDGEKHTLRKFNGDTIPDYLDSFIEIEMSTYEDNGKSLDKDAYNELLILDCLLFGFIISILEINSTFKNNRGYFYDKFNKLYYDFKKAIKEKKEVKNTQELKRILNELIKLINENEELKNNFDSLYERNKSLLEESNLLYEIRGEDFDTGKVNNLIKKYSKELLNK